MGDIVVEQYTFEKGEIKSISNQLLIDYPIVYLLNNNSEIYIGESVRFRSRMNEHLKNPLRQKLTQATVIGCDKFNQSATFNIESNLINYIMADDKYTLQNIAKKSISTTHNYFNKSYYNRDLFSQIWRELMKLGIVENSLEVISDKDIFKISPFKELSEEQLEIRNEIINFCEKNLNKHKHHIYLIDGDAGTGKSVVLSSIFKLIQDLTKDKTSPLYKSINYLVVNHSEMLKTYENIASRLPNIAKKNIKKPTSLINELVRTDTVADIVIVDEAHLLLSQKDAFNSFVYDNHLEQIIKRSKVTILIFDKRQSLRIKGLWDDNLIDKLLKNSTVVRAKLTQQFRIQASQEVINWLDAFIDKKLLEWPKKVDKDEDNKFDFKVYDNLSMMYQDIVVKNKEHGLSRIISTFDFTHKKDGALYYVEEGDFKLPWNIVTDDKVSWAERPETINQVGSTYTIQGFDLNYAGVIIGDSVTYDYATDALVIRPAYCKDVGAFQGASLLQDGEAKKELLILNALNVLIKRGVKGLYIYATDPTLRKRLLELQSGSSVFNN